MNNNVSSTSNNTTTLRAKHRRINANALIAKTIILFDFFNVKSKWRKRTESRRFEKLLRRYMIEKYSNKSIDDKKLISIKSNLIYWSKYWLFDVLQLTNIETYLYFTIYEKNNFDVELDSYLNRFHVVKWISRDESLRESFNKTFLLRSFVYFMIHSLRIWTWSLNRWIWLIEDWLRSSSKLA
jgi:hypothetical protein